MTPYHWKQPERPFAADADRRQHMPWLKRTPLWKRIWEMFW